LHWYTTVVIWRRRNFFKWWHLILLCTFFLGHRRSFSYNPSPLLFFSSPAQEVLPLTNLFPLKKKVLTLLLKGASSPRPLWSLLSHLHFYIFLSSYIPREVPGRRWFGFLVIPGFKEISNVERQHPEPISSELDVA
jgi:hypothetical protein